MLRTVNQIAVFIIELVMIGTLACFGFQKGASIITKYLLAFSLPVAVILLWGYFAAPKSSHRLAMPYLVMFRLILFLFTAYLLYHFNQSSIAIAVALVSIVTQIADYLLNNQ